MLPLRESKLHLGIGTEPVCRRGKARISECRSCVLLKGRARAKCSRELHGTIPISCMLEMQAVGGCMLRVVTGMRGQLACYIPIVRVHQLGYSHSLGPIMAPL